jgi:hypothetical protein
LAVSSVIVPIVWARPSGAQNTTNAVNIAHKAQRLLHFTPRGSVPS